MIDVEPLIGSSFERIFPSPAAAPDWNDVIRRAGGCSRARRRRVGFALAFAAVLAAAIAVSPLGATIARSISDFSGWLQGSPGKPASTAAQRAFERGNAKSWAGFPRGTTLRQLIKTSADGVEYTLFGFRSGASLCLRVLAEGAARGSTTSCAPLRELRARPEPALVMNVDYSVGKLPGKHAQIGPERYTLARASVSFGIVADGVTGIRLRSDAGVRQALVVSNSFLSVLPRPPAGDRVRAVKATVRDGSLVVIPFAEAPFDTQLGSAPRGTLHGPTKLDRVVKTGTIGWLDHHELRGTAWPGGSGYQMFVAAQSQFLFGRVIWPDRKDRMRIGLSLWKVTKTPIPKMGTGIYLCSSVIVGAAAGAGCGRFDDFFKRSPINAGLLTFGGGDQYSTLYGTASDDVVSVRLYLGTGEVVSLPLRDNVFVTQVSRAKLPYRVVGYDARGRVIANQAMQSDIGTAGPQYRPAKNAKWKKLATVTTATGGDAELWTVPSAAGGVCWRLHYPNGAGAGGCRPLKWAGALRGDVIPSGRVGTAPVLVADAGAAVSRVVVGYASGQAETVKPVDGFVFYAVPRERLDDRVKTITAYDAAGTKIGVVKVPH